MIVKNHTKSVLDSPTHSSVSVYSTDRDKSEYGDFQTPLGLARQVCRWLKNKGVIPYVSVEPTFGQGHFIIAALETFPSIQYIYGVEIYEPYIRATKKHLDKFDVSVQLVQDDVFHFPFSEIAKRHRTDSILVLGNPPWVTNSLLSVKDSTNLPTKLNFKNVAGIEAMTGKGNFDIGESVSFAMLNAFAKSDGHLAFLVKNIVAKNIVHAQRQLAFPVAKIEQVSIDAKKEFDAAVDASLFFAKFNQPSGMNCAVSNSFEEPVSRHFGWVANRFVSNIGTYQRVSHLDGTSNIVWRQGIKHDCAKVMELSMADGFFENGFGETVKIENDIVYPFLKSSDLKIPVITETRKFVIVPQTFIGQNTEYIARKHPETFRYLNDKRELFERRKSSIYTDKPPFSIFGIGNYSFKPYKIAISGLYKQTQFSLVLPSEDKPKMLDDTCYFLGFDSLPEAVCVWFLLNLPVTRDLLQSLVFWDGKRVITKDLLMRLNYIQAICETDRDALLEYTNQYNITVERKQLEKTWQSLKVILSNQNSRQLFD